LHDKVISQIKFELEQIERLFEVYQELLQKALQQSKPDLVEVTALASVVHSFYMGLKNIFVSIAKRLDQSIPEGPHWHRDLLFQMGTPTANRASVLTSETVIRLNEYLGFRHFFRHSYSFFLEWDELEKLVRPMETFWKTIKAELHLFTEGLEKA
jgi:hypothetical protein